MIQEGKNDQKNKKKVLVNFLGYQNPGSGVVFSKMLDPDSMNPDPKHRTVRKRRENDTVPYIIYRTVAYGKCYLDLKES
jgi:hypothetical protein